MTSVEPSARASGRGPVWQVLLAIVLLVALLVGWRWLFHHRQTADMREALAALELPHEWQNVRLESASEFRWHPLCVDSACPWISETYTASVNSATALEEVAQQLDLLDLGQATILEHACNHLAPCRVEIDAGSWNLIVWIRTEFDHLRGPDVPTIEGVIDATIRITARADR